MLLPWVSIAALAIASANAGYTENAKVKELKARYQSRSASPRNVQDTHYSKLHHRAKHHRHRVTADACGKATTATTTSTDGTISAILAYDCLMSVPFHQKEAIQLMDSLRPYIGMSSDLPWVKNPPAEYAAKVKQPYDFMGCFETVYKAAGSGSYTSEYIFTLDLQQCWAGAQDEHFGLILDIGGGLISFGREYNLVSASPDGKSPQQVYMWNDVQAAVNNSMKFQPSPIVKVNGKPAAQVFLEASQGAPIQDPDAAFNYLFNNLLAHPGLWTYGFPTAGEYPGATTTYEFANGTTLVDTTVAIFSSTFGSNTSVQTGEDFYQSYLAVTPGCDAKGIGAVSSYEYARCEAATSTNNSSTTAAPSPTPSSGGTGSSSPPTGFPAPVSSLQDTTAWGFFPNGKGVQNVAVLAFASFEDVNGNPIDEGALTTFLEDFFQKSKAAGRTKLILDISGNLGGFQNTPLQLFHALFPSITPVYGGNAQATDALNLLGSEFSYTIGKKGAANVQYMAPYSSYNYRTDVDMNGKNFTSWSAKLGPASNGPDGTKYTPYWRSTFDTLPLNVASPFTTETTVLFGDGICASSCATFGELSVLQAHLRTVAIGGRPTTTDMQVVGATRSFVTGGLQDVLEDVVRAFIEGELHTPEYYKNTVLGDFNTIPILRSQMNGLPLQLAQDPTDATMTPMMYKYQPADFLIPYTFQNVMSMEVRWEDVAAKVFN